MKKILFIIFLIPLFADAQNTNEDSLFIHKIAVNILSSDASYNNIHYLTKNIGQRLSGSPHMYIAEQWGAQALKNAGADNVMLQQCMVPHWVHNGADKAMVTYKEKNGSAGQYTLNILSLGNSVGTNENGIQAPLIRVNNFDELEAKKNELKGKIVFYNNPFDDSLVNTFGTYGKNIIYRLFGADRASRYGAVAVIIRSMTNTPGQNYPHTGALDYNDSIQKIPTGGTLSGMMHTMGNAGQNHPKKGASDSTVVIKRIPAAAMGLLDVKKLDSLFDENLDVTCSLTTYGTMLPDTIAHNVIGELKGSEHPEQIITVGGHLDSWYPAEGANDDGTGVVQTIEVLRVLKALNYQPKHTIHFVLFANEENGTRGAKQYADAAKKNNEQHIFALESDAGGFTPRGFVFDVDDNAVMQKINTWKPFFNPYYADRFDVGEAGADIGYLKEAFHTPQAGLNPDSQRYFYIHHAASDVLENVDIREMKMGAINMAALIYLVDKYGLQ